MYVDVGVTVYPNDTVYVDVRVYMNGNVDIDVVCVCCYVC